MSNLIYVCAIGRAGKHVAREACDELYCADLDAVVKHLKKAAEQAKGNFRKESAGGRVTKVELTKGEIENQFEQFGSAFFSFKGEISFWVNIYSVELLK